MRTAVRRRQWFKNNQRLPGANISSLFFTNTTFAHVGTYTLLASNPAGSTLSDPAILIMLPIQPIKIPRDQIQPHILQLLALPAGGIGITYYGAISRTYLIEASSDLIHWEGIAQRIASQNVNHFVDHQAKEIGRRFYRVKIVQ